MSIEVVTNDATALTDADLAEMASIEGAFDLDTISTCREEWVLATVARVDGELEGFMFSTLERIGGTPCVLIGMISVKRNATSESTLEGLMGEAYHRALMAFPDEDVVVGSRFVSADGLLALTKLDDVTPAPGKAAVGEERAWGRRLAKRFGVDRGYDAKAFVATNHRVGHIDIIATSDLDADQAAMLEVLDDGQVMIVYGWTMAEDLVELGAR
ncbi:MAG: hypothetical protein CSA55_01715 [Ilumatobacter coccineus]|uniref:N-acetyltransferase domain-containing protein n=1 Tax=Ilumatobacter coccineus TaxID=467094 RepID=A0A2G6KE97_9ACTN|nr:MAG: hypothetical protein CSA55_01715 [Ilumatobacter coccineus]